MVRARRSRLDRREGGFKPDLDKFDAGDQFDEPIRGLGRRFRAVGPRRLDLADAQDLLEQPLGDAMRGRGRGGFAAALEVARAPSGVRAVAVRVNSKPGSIGGASSTTKP